MSQINFVYELIILNYKKYLIILMINVYSSMNAIFPFKNVKIWKLVQAEAFIFDYRMFAIGINRNYDTLNI